MTMPLRKTQQRNRHNMTTVVRHVTPLKTNILFGPCWTETKLLKFDHDAPWVVRLERTNTIVGTVLLRQPDLTLVHVRLGASCPEYCRKVETLNVQDAFN